jgi:hypothetical protein
MTSWALRFLFGSWTTFSARLGGSVVLESIESELRVDEVYRDPLTER